MRLILGILLLLLLLVTGFGVWLKFEHTAPSGTVRLNAATVGRKAAIDLDVVASGWPGLRRVEVILSSGGQGRELFGKEYPPTSWFGSGVTTDHLRVERDLVELGVPEGEAELEVAVSTHAWHFRSPRRTVVARQRFKVDLSPPVVTLVSTQHNLRLGGCGVVVFTTSADAEKAGVVVGDYFFPAKRGYFANPNAMAAIFAVPQDLNEDARPEIRVSDAAGNSLTVAVPVQIKPRKFPEREMPITDDFLQRKVPELLSINRLPAQPDLVKGYLYINGDFRKETERQLRQVTETSAPRPLWEGVFHRQSNAAPMSAFADRRVYTYKDQVIDRQTHLGYDLASLSLAPVEATQNGVVAFAGNLGIYGNTVVLDHGFGVFSLYGHLSTISVQQGQEVKRAQTLGQTGQTGLAGGDHLHFSIMIHGVHVDPVEWWDGKWIKDHVAAKLNLLPVAQTPLEAPPPSAPVPAPPASAAEKANEEKAHGQARP